MKKAFTLIETLIVVIIAWILLSITFNLGWDYINFLRYKQDRENMVNLIDKTIIRTRSTNYYDGVKYSYLDLLFREDGIDISYGTWTPTTDACGWWTLIDTYDFQDMLFSWLTDTTVRIEPFVIECSSRFRTWAQQNQCHAATWLNLTTISTISDDETCYEFSYEVCKFLLVNCS